VPTTCPSRVDIKVDLADCDIRESDLTFRIAADPEARVKLNVTGSLEPSAAVSVILGMMPGSAMGIVILSIERGMNVGQ